MDKYKLGDVDDFCFDVLLDEMVESAGTYTLSTNITNYQFLIIEHSKNDGTYLMSDNVFIGKCDNYFYTTEKAYMIKYGIGSTSYYTNFHFSEDGNDLIVDSVTTECIRRIIGVR